VLPGGVPSPSAREPLAAVFKITERDVLCLGPGTDRDRIPECFSFLEPRVAGTVFFFWPFSVLVWLWYACERRIRLYEHCRRRAARGVPVDIPRRRSLASTVTFFKKKY
jgi:hypothetical protein